MDPSLTSVFSRFFVAGSSVALMLGLGACAAELSPSAPGDSSEVPTSEDDISVSTVLSFELRQEPGFMAPPPPGFCLPSASSWSYDFSARKLTGTACDGTKPTKVNRTLTAAEHASLRKGLAAVKTVKKPSVCPVDIGSTRLVVKRAKSTTSYITQTSSCFGKHTAASTESLSALSDILTGLSSAQAPAACRRAGCSGQLCADQDVLSTCEFRPEYACYATAICERGADGQCGFRATNELKSCLSKNK